VYTDYIIKKPALNCVTTDPYKSVVETLQRLVERGYRRPGLFIETERDSRTHFRFCAPFRSFPLKEKFYESVPPLLVKERDRSLFARWFLKYKPDVVLSHHTDALDWMEELGARVCEFECALSRAAVRSAGLAAEADRVAGGGYFDGADSATGVVRARMADADDYFGALAGRTDGACEQFAKTSLNPIFARSGI
jgi:hypothetical protein